MIISDLNHFEEVVFEAASIVGGEDAFTLTPLNQQLVVDLVAQIAAINPSLPLEITIDTTSVTTSSGGITTATVGSITAGEEAGGSFASSSAIA